MFAIINASIRMDMDAHEECSRMERAMLPTAATIFHISAETTTTNKEERRRAIVKEFSQGL